ncbi:hypothetical protein VTK26DRAFT_6102 [Humicola hyalothermophila]
MGSLDSRGTCPDTMDAENKHEYVVNGDTPTFATLRHLLTFPAVQDSVRYFQASPVGKMSMQLSNAAYQRVGAPLLSLLDKPYKYVVPYVERADEYGDQTLSKVEEKYPIVKKPSPELIGEAKQAIMVPVKRVEDIYGAMYNQAPAGPTGAVRAAIKTAAVVTGKGLLFGVQKVNDSLSATMASVETVINNASAGRHNQNQSQGTEAKGSSA